MADTVPDRRMCETGGRSEHGRRSPEDDGGGGGITVQRRGLLLGAALVTAGFTGCVEPPPTNRPRPSGSPEAPRAPASVASPGPRPSSSPSRSAGRPVSTLARFRAEVAGLERQLDAALGVAVAVAGAPDSGDPSAQGDHAGRLTTGAAWSTAKVPLALAALAAHPGRVTDQLVSRAIRQSDNAAAQQLWDAWSTPELAAAAVTAVLRAGADARTVVPTAQRRTGHSVVGQTEWALGRQARFAAELGCLPYGDVVLDHMRHVDDNQRWGISTSDGFTDVARKGGWGPGTDGYLVRQLAVATTAGRTMGIALAARTTDGSFTAGTQALDALTALLGTRLTITADGRCRR